MTELPRIISVDDHVIEPAHLFETWLPQKYRDRGPQPLTAGIGELAYIGGKYQITMDPDGQLTDWWIYEDLKFPYKAQHRRRSVFDRGRRCAGAVRHRRRRPGRRRAWRPRPARWVVGPAVLAVVHHRLRGPRRSSGTSWASGSWGCRRGAVNASRCAFD
ncbi:hypothetical protein SAURM35S_09701 [Streptomyces aurantiogriseus]